MADLTPQPVTEQDLADWFRINAELKALKLKESLLRAHVFKGFFPDPKEGTNSLELSDGFTLKAVHTINRNVDEGALVALKDELRKRNIEPDELIKYKPELKKANYNKLTAEEQNFFDQVLIVKDGSPQISIVKPKED